LTVAGVLFYQLTARSQNKNADQQQLWAELGKISAVTVNGEKVSQLEFLQALELAHGSEVRNQLIEQEVIQQEAQRLSLAISAEESGRIAAAVKDDPLSTIHESQRRAALMLEKIALRQVSAQEKQATYADFRDDLKLYELQQWRFADATRAKKWKAAVEAGSSTEAATRKYAEQGDLPLPLGAFSISEVHGRFGQAAALAIDGLKPGQRTDILPLPQGMGVFQVRAVADSYQAAESRVERMVARSKTSRVLFALVRKAHIKITDEPIAAHMILGKA
jgi:hypothetical protein